MDQTERKKDPNGSWKRAQAQASEIKQERDMAVAQNTSDKGDQWEVVSLRKAESVAPPSGTHGSRATSSKQTVRSREPERSRSPPRPRDRRRKKSSSSSPSLKPGRRSKRHNVLINIG